MGKISIFDEKQMGGYTYESDIYKITGTCRYDLSTKKFDSADGTIYKNSIVIGFFSSYTEANSNEIKTNISNISSELLTEIVVIVAECLSAVEEYYN